MICGRRGIGKATLAYRFARFLLTRGGAGEPAGLFGGTAAAPRDGEGEGGLYVDPNEAVFRRVASGGHSDFMAVEPGFDDKKKRMRSEIIVDDVRRVSAFFGLTPAEGDWRVVVVDSADEMNRNAANALLKVLEEPPRRAVLLLVSHGPGRLAPTIRSRCRRLVLEPLGDDTVATLVARRFPGLAPEEVAELARLSDGSAGRALSLAEEGGLDLYRELLGLLETLPALDVPALHAFANRLAKSGAEEAYRTVTGLFGWWLGRLVARVARGDGPTAPVPEVERALMERLAGTGNLDRWLEVWEKSARLLARAENTNLDRGQVVLNLFLGLAGAARV